MLQLQQTGFIHGWEVRELDKNQDKIIDSQNLQLGQVQRKKKMKIK